MKKVLLLTIAFGVLAACAPAPAPPVSTPLSETDLQGTAAVLSEQTLQALPTWTAPPSHTPVVSTATQVLPSATQTQGTLTGTPAGTLPANTTTGTVTGTLNSFPPTPTTTIDPLISATLTTTAHPQHYGTMPPYLPFGWVTLINRSKVEVYISLQCTTQDGFFTVIETPVTGTTKIKAPAGKYTYVAWVGGRQIIGKFSLGKNGELRIRIFKDHLEIG